LTFNCGKLCSLVGKIEHEKILFSELLHFLSPFNALNAVVVVYFKFGAKLNGNRLYGHINFTCFLLSFYTFYQRHL